MIESETPIKNGIDAILETYQEDDYRREIRETCINYLEEAGLSLQSKMIVNAVLVLENLVWDYPPTEALKMHDVRKAVSAEISYAKRSANQHELDMLTELTSTRDFLKHIQTNDSGSDYGEEKLTADTYDTFIDPLMDALNTSLEYIR